MSDNEQECSAETIPHEKSNDKAPVGTPKQPAKPTLSTLNISRETVQSAIEELLKEAVRYQKAIALKAKGDASEFDAPNTNIFIQLAYKIPPLNEKLRPFPIPLKHSLADEDDDVIFFVKDPQRAVKDYLEQHGNGGVTRVLGVEKLRKRYGTHEGRRELMNQYDRFLVDARIAPMMPRLLGNAFIKSKRVPLSVDMRNNITAAIKRTLSSTQFYQRRGSTCTIMVGKPDFTAEQVVENIEQVLTKIVPKIEGGWDNVQSLHVKTTKSPALPVYVTLLEMTTSKKRGHSELVDDGESVAKKHKAETNNLGDQGTVKDIKKKIQGDETAQENEKPSSNQDVIIQKNILGNQIKNEKVGKSPSKKSLRSKVVDSMVKKDETASQKCDTLKDVRSERKTSKNEGIPSETKIKRSKKAVGKTNVEGILKKTSIDSTFNSQDQTIVPKGSTPKKEMGKANVEGILKETSEDNTLNGQDQTIAGQDNTPKKETPGKNNRKIITRSVSFSAKKGKEVFRTPKSALKSSAEKKKKLRRVTPVRRATPKRNAQA